MSRGEVLVQRGGRHPGTRRRPCPGWGHQKPGCRGVPLPRAGLPVPGKHPGTGASTGGLGGWGWGVGTCGKRADPGRAGGRDGTDDDTRVRGGWRAGSGSVLTSPARVPAAEERHPPAAPAAPQPPQPLRSGPSAPPPGPTTAGRGGGAAGRTIAARRGGGERWGTPPRPARAPPRAQRCVIAASLPVPACTHRCRQRWGWGSPFPEAAAVWTWRLCWTILRPASLIPHPPSPSISIFRPPSPIPHPHPPSPMPHPPSSSPSSPGSFPHLLPPAPSDLLDPALLANSLVAPRVCPACPRAMKPALPVAMRLLPSLPRAPAQTIGMQRPGWGHFNFHPGPVLEWAVWKGGRQPREVTPWLCGGRVLAGCQLADGSGVSPPDTHQCWGYRLAPSTWVAVAWGCPGAGRSSSWLTPPPKNTPRVLETQA